ncbi:thioredoxin family protein [Lignipirellula cremea]|uniref:Thiol reductase thioredoxin n=1 Tax=Lignipirellula cremea TaxID=2528010 RepID=A0A518DWH1_9BACT|nr:thioredoxin family protein [Lignipirellula cremea]QDU96185.1 hypothetical protein Pla8534_40040 [Lignipirellula cremea]
MDFGAKFPTGLTYQEFLAKYGTEAHQQRWAAVHATSALTAAQKELLGSFRRQVKVLCMAGAWCGDCVEQCPIFDHIEQASPAIEIRYFDRDDNDDLREALSLCGGARVPQVVFLNEDDQFVGRYGDRTLAKYRSMAADKLGAGCPTGIVPPAAELTGAVAQGWIDEFERVQLMLRTSPRLREKHND